MLSYSISVITLAVLLALFTLRSLYNFIQLSRDRQRIKIQHNCQPSYHKLASRDPLFGIDVIYEGIKAGQERRFLEMIRQRFRTYGNTFTSRLARVRTVSTIEPANIKTILSTNFKDYGLFRRMDFLGKLLGKGIFTSDGEAWAHSRALLRPSFAREQIADLNTFEKHMQQLFQLIPADGTTVDLKDLFFRFTMDSATEFLFGHAVGSLKSLAEARAEAEASVKEQSNSDSGKSVEELVQEKEKDSLGDRFPKAMSVAQNNAIMRVRMLSLARFYRSKEEDEAIKVIHDFVDQFVEDAVQYRQKADLEKRSAEKGQYLFLHELAKATDDKLQLRSELLSVLLAGRDTTASLLTNMFFEIARRPDVWKKLQDEVAYLEGASPTYQQLRDLKYVRYCMNESLRLHPVVPGNSRSAVRDTVLPLGGGPDGKSPLFVPKGTLLIYHVYSMHRREDLYGEDANEFKPERWETLRPGWDYLPFNGGPRICLGQQYALTEAAYVTTRLLQQYAHIESRDAGAWQEELTLIMCSRNGTRVALTAR